MNLYRIEAPHFVAGIETRGVVVRAAPVVRYMLGWDRARVMSYCAKKGWKIEYQNPEAFAGTSSANSFEKAAWVPPAA